MFNSTLKSEDVKFFYRVLYQYEKEGTGRHTGYSYKDVPLKTLIPQHYSLTLFISA